MKEASERWGYNFNMGAPEILAIISLLILVAIPALFLWALVDALRHPDDAWSAIGQTKIVWVLVIIFLPLLGALLYLAMIRRDLASATVAA